MDIALGTSERARHFVSKSVPSEAQGHHLEINKTIPETSARSTVPATQSFPGDAKKRPIIDAPATAGTHTYFGTRFCAPDTHPFWQNRARGGESRQIDQPAEGESRRFMIRVQVQTPRFDFSSRPSAMLLKGFSASIPERFIVHRPVRIGVNFARVFFGSRRNALARCGLQHSKRTVENDGGSTWLV
jgi:hypothetical protein